MKIRTREDYEKVMNMPKSFIATQLIQAYDLIDAWEDVLKEELGMDGYNDIFSKVVRYLTTNLFHQADPTMDEDEIEDILDKTDNSFRRE